MSIKVCDICAGSNVWAEANAKWDSEKNEWVLKNVFLDEFPTYCDDCCGQIDILDADEMLVNVINERENDDLSVERAEELDELYLRLDEAINK